MWGKQSMKKAEVVLDLPNDRARVKGTWVDLVVSDCNHYGLNMLPKSVNVVKEVDKKNENNDVSKEDVFKRENLKQRECNKWSGSDTVIEKNGNVYQSSSLRVSLQRMIGIKEAEKMIHEGDGEAVEERGDEFFFKDKEDYMLVEEKKN